MPDEWFPQALSVQKGAIIPKPALNTDSAFLSPVRAFCAHPEYNRTLNQRTSASALRSPIAGIKRISA